jgi:SSS family solute:Na+ symporter
LKYSLLATFVIGAFALLLATVMTNVLDLMLLSYSFMVSGLFISLIAALFFKKKDPVAAIAAMISGGTTTLVLEVLKKEELVQMPWNIDPNIFGILMSLLVYLSIANRASYGLKE